MCSGLLKFVMGFKWGSYVSIHVDTLGKNTSILRKYRVQVRQRMLIHNSELKVDWIISLNKLVGALCTIKHEVDT